MAGSLTYEPSGTRPWQRAGRLGRQATPVPVGHRSPPRTGHTLGAIRHGGVRPACDPDLRRMTRDALRQGDLTRPSKPRTVRYSTTGLLPAVYRIAGCHYREFLQF